MTFLRKIMQIGSLFVFLAGCASTEGLETQIKMLKTEMQTQLDTQAKMLRSDMQTQNQSLNQNITDLKVLHEKDSKEIHSLIIELQKDFIANRRVVEDSARRVYLLEMLVTARRSTPYEQREKFIVFVKDKQVAISVGSESGIKVGEIMEVYKGGNLKNQIATIKIVTVEPESSSGEIITQTEAVSIGDRVEIKKR